MLTSLSVVPRLGRLLLRRGAADRAGMTLAVTAWAVVTALALSVVGGALWFHSLGSENSPVPAVAVHDADVYTAASSVAVALLVVPLLSLGGAAARLAARRRDERLSALSLLGATRTTLVGLTVAEATLLALVGCIIGFGGYLALMPVFGLVSFAGAPIGAAALWPGWSPVLLTVLGLVLLAVAASAAGLRRIVISPLGVRTRQDAPPAPWRALILGGVLLIGAVALSRNTDQSAEIAVYVGIIVVMFVTALGVMNLIGPFVVRMIGAQHLRLARSATGVLAARTVLEDPKALWRQIGGVAMTSLIAVVAGTGFAATDQSEGVDVLTADMRTGVLLTLAITFLTVACSVGINQAAVILDRRSLYTSLYQVGTPVRVMHRARVIAVMPALIVVALGSAGLGVLLIAPLGGMSLITASSSMLVIAAVLGAGVLTVYGGLISTRPVLSSAVAAGS